MNNRKLNNILRTSSIETIKANLSNPKYSGFDVRDGKLIFKPTNQEVVPPSGKQTAIQSIYDQYGIASGIRTLYHQISNRFLGITRQDVEDFLRAQSSYQIAKKKPKQINRKQYASNINKQWYIDLIDFNPYVSQNRQYRFMMVAVDGFSKFVMIEKLKTKDAVSIRDALDNICREQANANPSILVSDNGKEWTSNEMKAYCVENKIRQVFSPTYTPVALVEASNNIIRHIVIGLFLKYGKLNWEAHVDEILRNINDRPASSTGKSRYEIYKEGKHIVEVREKAKKQREEAIQRDEKTELEVGDTVRVYLPALSSFLRKQIKEGNQKLVVAKYSLELFEVIRKTRPKNKFLRETYTILEKATGTVVNRRFYYNELVKVPDNTIENQELNKKKMDNLNMVKQRVAPELNVMETRNRATRRE